jgi:hypothetical protein
MVDFENYQIKEPWNSFKEKDPIIGTTWDKSKEIA